VQAAKSKALASNARSGIASAFIADGIGLQPDALSGDRRGAADALGLDPYWAKDQAIGNKMINARVRDSGGKAGFPP